MRGWLLSLGAAVLLASPASAQVKLGYIDSARIFQEYKPAQEAQAQHYQCASEDCPSRPGVPPSRGLQCGFLLSVSMKSDVAAPETGALRRDSI